MFESNGRRREDIGRTGRGGRGSGSGQVGPSRELGLLLPSDRLRLQPQLQRVTDIERIRQLGSPASDPAISSREELSVSRHSNSFVDTRLSSPLLFRLSSSWLLHYSSNITNKNSHTLLNICETENKFLTYNFGLSFLSKSVRR